MARFELLVGSGDFWTRAAEDISAARSRVLVQAMTFEGDAAGLGVAQAISGSGAADRRVLVDDYTRHNLNDTMLRGTRDLHLLAEAEATWTMFDDLISQGVGVRISNPIGRNPIRYAARNHKKLLVMDGAAWIGGINFSDHNFSWHDVMLRIEDDAVADWLAAAFEADWQGEPQFGRETFGPALDIMSFDGVSNCVHARALLDMFANARRSVEVLSAYPTMPFTDAMARAAKNGAEVSILTPRPNNKPIIRDYLFGIAPRTGIDLRLTDGMTHAKAALIDGETLLLGSSNFDFVSYRLNSEYIAVIRDPELVAEVEKRLFAPARCATSAPTKAELGGWAPLRARLALRIADRALSLIKPGKRIAEWHRPR